LVIKNSQASKLKYLTEGKFDNAVLAPLNKSGIKIYDVLERPTESELDSSIREDSLLVVCGGDGTVSRIANHIIKRELPNIMLPRPYGGANDIPYCLYGDMGIDDILVSALSDKAYTIEAVIRKNDQEQTVRALGYIGLGASGQAAKAINIFQNENKNSTELDVIITATKTVLTSGSFAYSNSQNDKSESEAIEILAINNRMSKFLKSENTTFAHEFMSIEAKNKSRLIGQFCLGLFGNMMGKKIIDNQYLSINTLSPTVLQSDGEYIDIGENEEITVRNGPPINVLRIHR
jgi:diacylglycerol kinase family enzyme